MRDREKARRLYELNYEKEQLEKALDKLVAEHGSLCDKRVVACSQKLDAVLNEFERLRKAG